MALEPAKLSEFAIVAPLGAGTTAKVYEALHAPTGRRFAIKLLEPSRQGAEMRERFAREALLLSGVASRHVAAIVGFGFERGQPFLVLELLRGETLDAKLRRDGPVPPRLAVRWIEQLIVAVRDCHDANVIHRDIKPSNIFLQREGPEEVVKVIDFGVARLREITGSLGGLTSEQQLIGSTGYMAPEQFRDAKSVDFAADIYAVGVVVFRMLAGRLPFVSRTLEATIRLKMQHDVPLISSMAGLRPNARLDGFVKTAMARDAGDRFRSAREMLEHWRGVVTTLDEEAPTDVMRPERRGEPSSDEERLDDETSEDERTMKRMPVVWPPGVGPTPHPAPPPPALTVQQGPPPSLDVPTGEEPLIEDLLDMPTKLDPDLRRRVERELALQRRGRTRR